MQNITEFWLEKVTDKALRALSAFSYKVSLLKKVYKQEPITRSSIQTTFWNIGREKYRTLVNMQIILTLIMFNLQSKSLRTIFYFYQGCALAEPGGPWRLTFALRQQEHLRFFIQIICWAPWILQFLKTLGSLQFFLEHSLVYFKI